MFRDFKTGGDNLEDTKVTGERLISLIVLIAIAYTSATIQGQQIKRKGVQEYVVRVKRKYYQECLRAMNLIQSVF
jgi:hypothetical protein